MKFFSPIFWWAHGIATQRLRVKLIEGQNDLEYAYGQDLSQEVLYETTDEGYTIMYPADFVNSRELYPVVVWGNGTANTYRNYEPALRSLASYGFIVVGCDDNNMGDGQTLHDMAIYMKDLQNNPVSLFYGRLDVNKIGVAGHSQGACGAVNAATRFEDSGDLFASVFTTSLPKQEMCVDNEDYQFAYWQYDMSKITVPYFGNTGTRFLDSMWISPLESMKENYALLNPSIEAYCAREIGANHNIVNEYHACGYFNAWFCYTLKGDERAALVFKGENPELLRNGSRWKDVLLREENVEKDA